jgi:hypothetical protein
MSADIAAGMRSAQVARAAGVHQQTLRYYERRGLLAEPDRTLAGIGSILPRPSLCYR